MPLRQWPPTRPARPRSILHTRTTCEHASDDYGSAARLRSGCGNANARKHIHRPIHHRSMHAGDISYRPTLELLLVVAAGMTEAPSPRQSLPLARNSPIRRLGAGNHIRYHLRGRERRIQQRATTVHEPIGSAAANRTAAAHHSHSHSSLHQCICSAPTPSPNFSPALVATSIPWRSTSS